MARTRKIQTNRQQSHILLLTLFLLKHKHYQPAPKKRQVLNFIRLKDLMWLSEADLTLLRPGETSWENDISWRREDLTRDGSMFMPERGIWKITDDGEQVVLEWCAKLHEWTTIRPNWRVILSDLIREFYSEFVVLKPAAVEAALQIYAEAPNLFPQRVPQKPTGVFGGIL